MNSELSIMTGHDAFHGCLSSAKGILPVTTIVNLGPIIMRLLHVYSHSVNCKLWRRS